MRTVHFGSSTLEFKASCIIATDKSLRADSYNYSAFVEREGEKVKILFGLKPYLFLFVRAVATESAPSVIAPPRVQSWWIHLYSGGTERDNRAASFHFFCLCFMVRICPVSRAPAGVQ